MPSQYTKEQMVLFQALTDADIPVKNCDSLYIPRDEKNIDGKTKVYIPDFAIGKRLLVEVYGPGSASKGNKARNEYLKSLGYWILSISNGLIKHDLDTAVKLVKVSYKLIQYIEDKDSMLALNPAGKLLAMFVLERLTEEYD